MKIAHVCLSNFFIDGRSYQENELVRQHVTTNHDVLILASTETHSDKGDVIYCEPGAYTGVEGARVIRLPYARWLPQKAMLKLRFYPNVYQHLVDFTPDAIMFHGASAGAIIAVAKYARENPTIPFYIDNHADRNNSGKGYISREILHRRYYGTLLRRTQVHADKILCTTPETMDFVREIYRIPEDRLEFFPLGGRPVPQHEYDERRAKNRASMALDDSDIAVVQSGKQTQRKKLLESLRAFREAPNPRLKFFIAGSLMDDIREEAEALIAADERIQFLGWRDSDQLTDLLCCADLYLQPGTQSVTMQHSLCCHTAIAIDDVKAHAPYMKNNGWLLSGETSLTQVLIEACESNLAEMGEQSYALAESMLDYAVLGKRILRK